MADKFNTLYQSINDTLKNPSIQNKEVMIKTLLQPQTLTSLKKLCTKKFLNVSGCTSQKVTGTTTEKKDHVLSLILNHLFVRCKSNQDIIPLPKPQVEPISQPEVKPEVETQPIQRSRRTRTRERSSREVLKLRTQLRREGIRENITALTNNEPERMKELLNNDRCSENTDYDDCNNEDSCYIKNKLCINKNITNIRNLERIPIIKNGQTYYVLTTKEKAQELQNEIDSKTEYRTEDNSREIFTKKIKQTIDDIIDPDEDVSYSKLKKKIISKFPDLKTEFIIHVIRDYLKNLDYDIKTKPFNDESIFKSPQPEPEPEPELDTRQIMTNKIKKTIDNLIDPDGDVTYNKL